MITATHTTCDPQGEVMYPAPTHLLMVATVPLAIERKLEYGAVVTGESEVTMRHGDGCYTVTSYGEVTGDIGR